MFIFSHKEKALIFGHIRTSQTPSLSRKQKESGKIEKRGNRKP